MHLLLDENLPRRLKFLLIGFDVSTVAEMGWSGTKNGTLLQLAAANFDVLVTMDRGIEYQQNLGGLELAVVALSAASNRLETLQLLVPWMLEVLPEVQPGTVTRVGKE